MRQLWGLLVMLSFLWLFIHTSPPQPSSHAADLLGPMKDIIGFYTREFWLAVLFGSLVTGLCWSLWHAISGRWR